MKGRSYGIKRWCGLAAVALAMASVALSGCDGDGMPFVISLQPFYAVVDAETDARLSGVWGDSEGEVTFSFEPMDQKGKETEYRVLVKEKDGSRGVTGEFTAHLMHLGGFQFLDFYPRGNAEGSEFYRAHFVRGHTIARVDIREDSLQLAFFSASWLKKRIKDGGVDTAHTQADDWVLLTGTTEETQRLVFDYANDNEAFSDALLLERLRDQEEGQ